MQVQTKFHPGYPLFHPFFCFGLLITVLYFAQTAKLQQTRMRNDTVVMFQCLPLTAMFPTIERCRTKGTIIYYSLKLTKMKIYSENVQVWNVPHFRKPYQTRAFTLWFASFRKYLYQNICTAQIFLNPMPERDRCMASGNVEFFFWG